MLYIDPGTGSMLFTVLLGLIGAAVYSLRMLLIKLRFRMSGGFFVFLCVFLLFSCKSLIKLQKLV